jgi:hypothetical protein
VYSSTASHPLWLLKIACAQVLMWLMLDGIAATSTACSFIHHPTLMNLEQNIKTLESDQRAIVLCALSSHSWITSDHETWEGGHITLLHRCI